MQITSDRVPSPPLNGDVSLAVTRGPGHYEELDLDYVDWDRDAQGRICLRCHDPDGHPVTVRVRETVMEDIMFPNSGLHHPSTPPDWSTA